MLDNKELLISVLIPSLNSQDYIKECVESVMNQTLEGIEILCIDAGSTDGTLNILNQLANRDSRVKIFNSDKKSYGYQMNIGLSNAKGKYVSIVESDDFIDKNMLGNLFDLAMKYDADIIKSTFYHYYDHSSGKETETDDAKKNLKASDTFKLEQQPLFLNGHPSIWAAIYKKEFLKENNIRFIEEDGAGWVDNPFFYETAFLANKIVYEHVPYYYYRETNQGSSSNSLSDLSIPIKRMMDNLDIVEKYDCNDELVLKEVYIRAFAYINNIFRRDGSEEYMDELLPLIQEMLLRLDEGIVLKYLKRKHIDAYYKYISPVNMLSSNEQSITISKNDWDLIKKENRYLYSQIENYKKDRQESKNQIRLLKRELKDNKSQSSSSNSINKIKSMFK